ncbi:MAG: hypothetical protein R3B36_13750 [Polyangiaceae bacterium]
MRSRELIFMRLLAFASTVLFAVVAARLIGEDRRYALLVAVLAASAAVPAWLARRRTRRVLLSGDVGRVLGSWSGSMERVAYPETMAPLMAATAYAAYGFMDAARNALEGARKGPVWDAAIEQRLFVSTLLDVYEGARDDALTKAAELEELPLPDAGFWMRRKVERLRSGVAAIARAFAHQSREGDLALLERAAKASPLVHWATRYAIAIIRVDAGDRETARDLIAEAPAWPEESAFHAFHQELLAAAS